MPTAQSWSNDEMMRCLRRRIRCPRERSAWPEIPLPLCFAILLLVSACAVVREEVAPTDDGLYTTAAWHPIFAETAVDRTADEAEEFCARTDMAMSVRDMEITRTLTGVSVRRWFKCVEP